MDQKIIVVLGPTATGKTKLAIALAKHFGGEIVSADSMQVYKGMDIGTAKASREEQAQVAHHLIDLKEPSEAYTLSAYLKDANNCFENILSRGKIPVLAGGTGLYISSLVENVELTQTPNDEAYRQELNAMDTSVLIEMLGCADPASAARLHPNDKKRIVRALEVFHTTGKTITELNEKSKEKKSPYSFFQIGLCCEDRSVLYERIDRRVDEMMENGFLKEVKKLDFDTLSQTARQAIGYRQLHAYLQGQYDLDTAVGLVKQESRRYAKRQMTWFRRCPEVHWADIGKKSFYEIWGDFVNALENYLKV